MSAPSRRVLHVAWDVGTITDRWIDLQCRATDRYEARLMGLRNLAEGPPPDRWIVLEERLDWELAFKGMNKSGGLSTAWLRGAVPGSRPDILHIHYGPLASQHRWLARALRCPFVGSFYGYDATASEYVESRLWRRRYRRLFRHAGALIVEGPAMAARVQALGCPEDKLAIVRLPADASSVDRVEAPKADDFVVAVAGRFVEKKGFDTAIRAFARGLGGRADARLLLVGGGPLEGEYRRLVELEGIAGQVEWGGRLPFECFLAAVSSAHVGLYPSRTAANGDSEGGAPVTLIDAQWAGVPSIVSNHDDLPFVAAPEGSIVLAPAAVEEWADALRMLYDERARLDRMGRAAAAFARAHHSPLANARAREEIYDRVSHRA